MTALAQTAPRAPLGEMEFTERDFRFISDFMRETAGIELPDSKFSLVYSRLTKRLRALKMTRFKDYCAYITSDPDCPERMELLNALTTNVTNFFREPHHFDDLRQNVLPDLATRAKRGERVRLWSAACSTGQEPYSMALCVLNAIPDAASLDVKILATDIDKTVIATAQRGQYAGALLQNVPDGMRRKFITPAADAEDEYLIDPGVKALVTFREMNLIRDWPVRGPFDVIFCRNVVIYFADATEQAVWSKFAKVLSPGGRLYIGHSERVAGPATSAFESVGVTAYRRKAS